MAQALFCTILLSENMICILHMYYKYFLIYPNQACIYVYYNYLLKIQLMRTFIVERVSYHKKVLTSFLVSRTLIQYGAVPLEAAAQNGHTKTVQRLLEAGANISHQNKVKTVNVQLPCK